MAFLCTHTCRCKHYHNKMSKLKSIKSLCWGQMSALCDWTARWSMLICMPTVCFCSSFSMCKQASETKLRFSTLSPLCDDNCSRIHPRGLHFTAVLPSEWHHCGLQQDPGLFPRGCFSNDVNLKFVYLIRCVTAAPLHYKSMKPCMTWRVKGGRNEWGQKHESVILNTSLRESSALLEWRSAAILAPSLTFSHLSGFTQSWYKGSLDSRSRITYNSIWISEMYIHNLWGTSLLQPLVLAACPTD